MSKKSLIGKKYIPCDNSWSVNVTDCGKSLFKPQRSFLAGICGGGGVECVIISEPFDCIVETIGIENPKSTHKMIMVNYNDETHMVLFYKNCVKN